MLLKLKSRTFAGRGAVFAAMMAAPAARAETNSRSRSVSAWRKPVRSARTASPRCSAMEIWVEETNAKGGLIGRPVQLIHYDDQSNPSTVPGIYTKLLDVDKVDVDCRRLWHQHAGAGHAGRYAAQESVPWSLWPGVNSDFKYDRYFAMIPSGPEPKTSFTKGFFDTAMEQNPKPTTVAIVAADAEFSKNASDGARENAKKAGLEDRLRQELSAFDHRLCPDRSRDPGDQSRPCRDLLLSARLGRHGAAATRLVSSRR